MEKKTYQQGFIDFTGKNILKKKISVKALYFGLRNFTCTKKIIDSDRKVKERKGKKE